MLKKKSSSKRRTSSRNWTRVLAPLNFEKTRKPNMGRKRQVTCHLPPLPQPAVITEEQMDILMVARVNSDADTVAVAVLLRDH